MRRTIWGVILPLFLLSSPPQRPAIKVINHRSGETVRYPVLLLKGTVSDQDISSITVINNSSTKRTRVMKGQVHKGRFKVLVELVPGKNDLLLRADSQELTLKINYRVQSNPYRVRVIYFTDRSGDTRYQTPFPDDPQDFRGKLDTAAKLMQTFTAEKFYELGLPRRTFNLDFDENGDVIVHVLKGDRTKEEYWKMDGGELYREVANEIGRKMPHPTSKNLVIIAFTYFDPRTKRPYAHTALGGGNLALFGGGDLFTWPNDLQEVQIRFMDERKVDPDELFSDSVGRDTFWACASTTIGASLHELGHTFGLPHSADPYDIMSRGHDFFNRAFTLLEPPHARRSRAYKFREDEEAYWAPINAEAMLASRWFALDERSYKDENLTDLLIDRKKDRILVFSPYGIRFIGFSYRGESIFHIPLALRRDAPKEVAVPLAELGKRIGSDREITIRTIDAEGNSSYESIERLIPGCFLQDWQFSQKTVEWQDPSSFPHVSDEMLREIEASARSAPLRHSSTPFVDFSRIYRDRRSHVAGYAFRLIRSERQMRLRILTGSDDSLRIWFNGKPLKEVLRLRSPRPDEDIAEIDLLPGENRLLVEVSNWEGNWGLFLRFEGEDKKGVILTKEGDIKPWDESEDERIRSLLLGPWIRKWHFSRITKPWEDKSSFPHLTEGDIREIIASAMSNPLIDVTEGGPFVDFAKYYEKLGKTTDIAGYVVRKIYCKGPREVKILTGSDDALRIWLNGELLKEVLALRSARKDQDSLTARLRDGENILLVEVANGGGDWGLFLRIEGEDVMRWAP